MHSEDYTHLCDNDNSPDSKNPLAWALVKIINGPNGKAALGAIVLMSAGAGVLYYLGVKNGHLPPINVLLSRFSESAAA